uniref:nuclear pore complex protein Nup85-like n=1 Tax=Pristiophorus japonicus TaxID=55135 RepID=UPI00398E8175
MEDLDSEHEPVPTNIPGVHPDESLGFEWGPTQIVVYPTKHTPTDTPPDRSSPMAYIQVVCKDKDVYSPILSKLFNESHGIFMTLQKAQQDCRGRKME